MLKSETKSKIMDMFNKTGKTLEKFIRKYSLYLMIIFGVIVVKNIYTIGILNFISLSLSVFLVGFYYIIYVEEKKKKED